MVKNTVRTDATVKDIVICSKSDECEARQSKSWKVYVTRERTRYSSATPRSCGSDHFRNLIDSSVVQNLRIQPKFNENPFTTFRVILLRNKQTNTGQNITPPIRQREAEVTICTIPVSVPVTARWRCCRRQSEFWRRLLCRRARRCVAACYLSGSHINNTRPEG